MDNNWIYDIVKKAKVNTSYNTSIIDASITVNIDIEVEDYLPEENVEEALDKSTALDTYNRIKGRLTSYPKTTEANPRIVDVITHDNFQRIDVLIIVDGPEAAAANAKDIATDFVKNILSDIK